MKYFMEKRRRIKCSRYRDACTKTAEGAEHLWWDSGSRTWDTMDNHKLLGHYSERCLSSHTGKIRSVRAFRRHLRKYGVPGVRYELCSRFMGHNVTAVCRRKG